MLKKVVLADTLAAAINPAFENCSALSTVSAWLVVLGYSYQLYFDFSGYSDMAVGLGYLFGLRIPQNFDSPYRATDPSDFWRRWHISLSTCMRDYLYIPLGGNRRHANVNLLVTMLLGGLWHGANWTFILWGAYHGLALAAYRHWRSWWDAQNMAARRLGMFLVAVLGWVLFRANSLESAGVLYKKMFLWQHGEPLRGGALLVVALLCCACVAHLAPNTWQLSHKWHPIQAWGLALGFLISLALIYGFHLSPFLYFQF